MREFFNAATSEIDEEHTELRHARLREIVICVALHGWMEIGRFVVNRMATILTRVIFLFWILIDIVRGELVMVRVLFKQKTSIRVLFDD